MNRTLQSLLLLTGLGLATVIPTQAKTALVGHEGLSGEALNASDLKAVLLGKRVNIGSERVVIIVVKKSATQDEFLKANVGMTTKQFQNHWRRLFMTGGGSAPKLVDSEAAAIELAAKTPGGICIGDDGSADGLSILHNS